MTTMTRWCPTPEQLMILEEMYRGGVRTPNATQIQHITAHLSLYGKIEGKNVFYWFQNHKARDRQKLRRRLAKHQQLLYAHHHHHLHHHHPQIFNPIHPFPIPNPISHATCLSSPCFIHPHPQIQGDVWSEQAMSYNWSKMKEEEESAMKRQHDDDWVVISPGLNSRPIRTLELFPTTSSSCNVSEEESLIIN